MPGSGSRRTPDGRMWITHTQPLARLRLRPLRLQRQRQRLLRLLPLRQHRGRGLQQRLSPRSTRLRSPLRTRRPRENAGPMQERPTSLLMTPARAAGRAPSRMKPIPQIAGTGPASALWVTTPSDGQIVHPNASTPVVAARRPARMPIPATILRPIPRSQPIAAAVAVR